jgi:hypothetical protein
MEAIMRLNRSSVLALALALLPAAVSAASTARNYKWVDESGQVHYGSHPPPGIKAEPVSAPPPPPTGAALDGGAAASQQFTAGPAATGKRSAGRAQHDSEAVCASARQNLVAIQSRPRTRITEANGQVRFLSAEERQEEIRKAEETIQKHCL